MCWKRVYGRIQKFVDVLDVKGVGETTLQSMVEKGMVKTPADLFRVDYSEYQTIERKGEKHYEKLIKGLQASKKVTVSQIFAAMDIEGVGTFDNIVRVSGLDTFEGIIENALAGNVELFSKAVRVSEDKAEQIIGEIKENLEDIKDLRDYLEIKQNGKKLLGMTFVVTGSLTAAPRSQIEAWIKENGGTLSGSVSPKTTYLVSDDVGSNSSKFQKARQLGIKVITSQHFVSLIS